MKNKVALIIAVVIINTSNLFSQKINELSFSFGADSFTSKWQPNPNDISGTYSSSFDVKGKKKLNDVLDFELGLGYVFRELKPLDIFNDAVISTNSIISAGSNSVKFHYATLQSNLRVFPFDKRRFYLYGGLRPEYLIAYNDIEVTTIGSYLGDVSSTDFFEPVVDEFNTLTLWTSGGLGYRIANKIYIQSNVGYQLTSQTRNPDLKITNWSAGLSIGFILQNFKPKKEGEHKNF